MVRRRAATEEAAILARHFRGRELLRTAIADLIHISDWRQTGAGIAAATASALHGALLVAGGVVAERRGYGTDVDDLPIRLAVIGMGSFGGSSMGYVSDADVLFVHTAQSGVDQREQDAVAMAVVTMMQRLLKVPAPAAPPVAISADLRPEGRNGPLVRSLDSYAEYYRRWADTWEFQALLRAVPVAGDAELGRTFQTLIDPLRYNPAGLKETDARQIRRLKARMENERLPRGVSPDRHLKLGPGGLTDVEWVAQLLQLQHGHAHEQLRRTETAAVLTAARDLDLLAESDAEALAEALAHTVRLRNALALWNGRSGDILPTDRRDLVAAARLMGYGPAHSTRSRAQPAGWDGGLLPGQARGHPDQPATGRRIAMPAVPSRCGRRLRGCPAWLGWLPPGHGPIAWPGTWPHRLVPSPCRIARSGGPAPG